MQHTWFCSSRENLLSGERAARLVIAKVEAAGNHLPTFAIRRFQIQQQARLAHESSCPTCLREVA